jgi:hypothetical protein
VKLLNIHCAHCDAPLLPEVEATTFTEAHAMIVRIANLHICPVRDADLLTPKKPKDPTL